jgi:hypothetical protein
MQARRPDHTEPDRRLFKPLCLSNPLSCLAAQHTELADV